MEALEVPGDHLSAQSNKVISPMTALNYKHLRYFWAVANSGSISRASQHLHLTPQTISGQLSELEAVLGVELFRHVGRGLELTDAGRNVFSYAEQIFALGEEILTAAADGGRPQAIRFRVGIADSVPKMVAQRLVAPALTQDPPVRLVCREGNLTTLLAELSVHHLDVVIADRPIPTNLNVRGYSHFLGESGVTVFGASSLIKDLRHPFPLLLNDSPFLLPGEDVAMHSRLLRWFEAERLRPRIVGEFDDSAMLNAFGQAGAGFFIGPTAIEASIVESYGVTAVGRTTFVLEQVFVISTERKLNSPTVALICRAAQQHLFAG